MKGYDVVNRIYFGEIFFVFKGKLYLSFRVFFFENN